MPKTKVTFEYTDKDGVTRQVGSVREVPKQYLNTMLAVGEDEPQEETSAPSRPAFDLQNVRFPDGMQPPLVLALLAAAVGTLKAKSFLNRVIAGTAAGAVAFYLVYSWADSSGLLRTSERKVKRIEAPTQKEEP